MVLLRASKRKAGSSKLCKNTTGIRQKGHSEFKVLRCSNKEVWFNRSRCGTPKKELYLKLVNLDFQNMDLKKGLQNKFRIKISISTAQTSFFYSALVFRSKQKVTWIVELK